MIIAGAALTLLTGLLSACSNGDQGEPEQVLPTGQAADPDRYPDLMTECLRDKGWAVEAKPDGAVVATYPAEQDEAYMADNETCKHQYGFDATHPPVTEAELRSMYKDALATVDCLREQGYDPGEVPSEQVFVDRGGWDPYYNVHAPGKISDEEYYRLLKLCPR